MKAGDWIWIENERFEPTPEELKDLRASMVPVMPRKFQDGKLEHVEPRAGQIRALYNLCVRKLDTILIARTGFGKSIISHLGPVLSGGLCVIISPLNALSTEQAADIERLKDSGAGVKALVLDGKNNGPSARKQALDKKLTHLITSPEILNSVEFRTEVLSKDIFLRRLKMVVLDEMHLAQQWSTFRNKYGKLHKFRTRIPKAVPWFGTSATLDPSTLIAAKEAAGFTTPVILRTTVDRPEIFYEFRKFEVEQKTYEDLRFLLPEKTTFNEAKKLPKTIIYLDTTKAIRDAHKKLTAWLRQAGLAELEAAEIVRPYYSRMSERKKLVTTTDFREADSTGRIILATDAMGMGVSYRGVELVIQWGVEKLVDDDSAVKTVVQRLGRAGRGSNEAGHFIWIIPDWVEHTQEVSKRVATNKKYVSMTAFFKKLFNPTICIRQTLLAFLAEPLWDKTEYPRYPYCCNKKSCQPGFRWESRQSKSPRQRRDELAGLVDKFDKEVGKATDIAETEAYLLKLPRAPSAAPRGWPWVTGTMQEKLEEWREKEAADAFKNAVWFSPRPKLVLPDKILKVLVKMNVACQSERIVQHFFPDWDGCEKYAKDIVLIAKECSKILKPDGLSKNKELKSKAQDKTSETEALENREERLRERYGTDYLRNFRKRAAVMKANQKARKGVRKGKASVLEKNRMKREIQTVRAPATPKHRTPERRPISISRPIRTYPNEKYCTPRSQIRPNINLRVVPHRNGATDALKLKQKVEMAIGEESEIAFEDGPINLIASEKPGQDSDCTSRQIGKSKVNPTTSRFEFKEISQVEPPSNEPAAPRKPVSGRQSKRTEKLPDAEEKAIEYYNKSPSKPGRAREKRAIRG